MKRAQATNKPRGERFNPGGNRESVMTDINELVTELLGTETEFTPYRVHKLLESVGINVRPQMMYNYVRNGMFKGCYTSSQGKIVIPRGAVEKYLVRKITKATQG